MKLEIIKLLSIFPHFQLRRSEPLYFLFFWFISIMLPILLIFVSNVKFFWIGLACKQDGMAPPGGFVSNLCWGITEPITTSFPIWWWKCAWSWEGVLPGSGVFIALAWETQAFLGGCTWGMFFGGKLKLVLVFCWRGLKKNYVLAHVLLQRMANRTLEIGINWRDFRGEQQSEHIRWCNKKKIMAPEEASTAVAVAL